MKHSVLLLLPTEDVSVVSLKNWVADSGIKARYNTGPIFKALANTFAPAGKMILPVTAQDEIFDPLDSGDYSDFDISHYWSTRDRKDIEKNGDSQHLIAACYASVSELDSLEREVVEIGRCYVWHRHQWVLMSKLDQINWGS